MPNSNLTNAHSVHVLLPSSPSFQPPCRLRLERIKRNQERLAALGLQDGSLKPKPKKANRRKSLEPKAPSEPTRKQSSRASKKRIDYAKMPKMYTIMNVVKKPRKDPKTASAASTSTSAEAELVDKPPPRELTPEELKRREKRRKEKSHNDRIPRFIYDEFQRIRSKRRMGLKKAKRHATKAEREKKHWAKMVRKLTAQEQKQAAIREKEEQRRQREREARQKEHAEREELDCQGMTKKELLWQIEMRSHELYGILAGHDQVQSATLQKHQQEVKEREELRKRQALERKLAVIDALDRFPKAMNEALTKLNGLLYARAPKDALPPRRSVRRKHGVAFPGTNTNTTSNPTTNTTVNTTPSQGTSETTLTSNAKPPSAMGTKNVSKSPKLIGSTGKKKLAGGTITGKTTSSATAYSVPSATNMVPLSPNTKKKKRGRPTLPMHSRDGQKSKSLLATNPTINISSTSFKQKKRGRPSMALPIQFHDNMPTKNQFVSVSALAGLTPPVAASIESAKKNSDGNSNSKEGATVPSGSSGTAKRRKQRDARFVGGWVSPKFSKELDRTWLERTKPIDNRPVVIVPDNVAKLAGVSAKKTAVFDLGSYVPQAGDIVLYYPSAHKDVMNTHPDTLGSRQRNLLRVPLWARASRDRNRLSKEDEKGTIWWTDEWVESLTTARKKSKKDKLSEAAATVASKGVKSMSADDEGDSASDHQNRNASPGDYPIICRVEKTHAEFPEDPYAKLKGKDGDGIVDGSNTGVVGAGNDPFVTSPKAAAANRLSLLAAAEAKKKLSKISPQVRLAVMLKPLSPIIPPSENSGLAGGGGLGLPPNFTVVTFPVAAPLEPFIIPFCWAYASFHTMLANETIWIRRASIVGNDGSRGKSDAGLCGKGKIIDFFVGAKAKKSKSSSTGTKRRDFGEGAMALTSSEPVAMSGDIAASGSKETENREEEAKYSVRLMENRDELKDLLASLTKDGTPIQEAIAAAVASEKEFKGAVPIREANILVDFFRRFLDHFESKTNDTATSLSYQPQKFSSTRIASNTSPPSLIGLILKTLPLRRGILVTYDSNRRQLHKASPWNLVTLQPTDLSRSLQYGLLGYLENSLREKAILCMKDLIENNAHAQLFVPMITELIAPSYYSAVPVGMSLDRILARLKAYGNTASCYYTSMESILVDLNLISENCLLYNNPESDLVEYCRDIVPKCQTLIKNIIQNRSAKGAQRLAESDVGGKRQALIVPSFLNTPFKGKINWEWLQQLTPSGASIEGEKVTRQATSSTWIPQCGESIFYSLVNHSKFVIDYHDFLDDLHCSVPDFKRIRMENQGKTEDESGKDDIKEDEFLNITSSHWLEGTVMSVRSSFPRRPKNKNESSVAGLMPILIIELRLHYSQCESNIFVCWRPTFESNKCKGSGLAQDSFLKPTWMSADKMQVFPSNAPQVKAYSAVSKEKSISITRCFDLLKQRCIDGISPDTVNSDLALENAEHGTTSNFDSHYLPSYSEFFTPADMKYSTRGIKRAGYKAAFKVLSEVGYMPLWSLDQQNQEDGHMPRHESWMPFPSLCLELIRLRISNGYYKNLRAVINDITESYICAVLYFLSESWTRNSDRVSIRKIAKYLMSPRANGKMSRISVKKKSKKKVISEGQTGTNQNSVPKKKKSKNLKESPFDKLSEEEETLTHRIFQIRKYHAAAIVFALEANHVEKIFGLVSTVVPSDAQPEIPDIDALKTANFTPDQMDGVARIRNLLWAIGRDPCRNRFKFSHRDMYKLKIKCGAQLITENGHLEMTNGESILFEPSAIQASLPDGSNIQLRVQCGNENICGVKKMVTDELFAKNSSTGSMAQSADPSQFYHSSLVGRNHFNFNSADMTNNEELVRTLFGSTGKMHPCVRCQSKGGSLFSCRVLRQHSNPDYDLVKNFKGTSGVDSLLTPWKEVDAGTSESAIAESNQQKGSNIATNSQLINIDSEEQAQIEDAAGKDTEEKEEAAALAKKASEAKENFEKADKAHKLARYLHAQAILLSDLEVNLSESFISTNFPFDEADGHYVFCIHCGCAGDLLICDGCPNVSHPKCAGLNEVPDDDWFCHKCTAKKGLASNASLPSKELDCVSHGIIEVSDDVKHVQEDSSQKDGEHTSDNSERAEKESSKDNNTNTNQDDHGEQKLKARTSKESENSSHPSDLPSNETNVEQNFKEAPVETKSKTEGPEVKAQEATTDGKTNTDMEAKTVESSVADKAKIINDQDRSKQTIDPEINDEEFDEKESELNKLLTGLIHKRFPPKDERVEQQEPERDPLDALGNTYVREFLSFLNIESAEELLSTKSGLIAKDLETWRIEKGMKPLSENSYGAAVSSWKNIVRKASGVARDKADRKGGENESLSQHTESCYFDILPSQGQKFCSYLGIPDAEAFLATRSSELARKLASWRKKQKMSKLSSNTIRYGIEYVRFCNLRSLFNVSQLTSPSE